MVRGTLVPLVCLASALFAEDWPEWRGRGRLGVWNESGIVDDFSKPLTIKWRTPVRSGFAGPAVAGGRVFVPDFHKTGPANKGVERLLALDESTGRVLWTREWDTDYTGLQGTYAIGPRATPTVDGDRVYVLGAMGTLSAFDVKTGNILWRRDYVKEFGTQVPVWGMAGSPLVDGERLIATAGGENNAKVVALDKLTGKEIWRALGEGEPGYNQPVIITAGGTRQLIVVDPGSVTSLDPRTGKQYWQQPYKNHLSLAVATPVLSGTRLLLSSFYNGSLMLQLDDARPAARVLWKGASDSEIKTDGLHALITTPVIDGDYIYGICSYGQLRCLDARTGRRVWETQAVTKENARWAAGHMVRHGDRYFINNDRGELIIARLSGEGYRELARTALIKPTSASGNRRELGAVHWSHPAYANRHIYVRNDEEIVAASLAR